MSVQEQSVRKDKKSDVVSSTRRTPLYNLHLDHAAKMVNFADYDMPLHYPLGILKEHLWTRENCGMFDVSHMGQVWAKGGDLTIAKEMEKALPVELQELAKGKQRYSQILSDRGTVVDDLIIANPSEEKYADRLYMVVNAGRKSEDLTHLRTCLPNVDFELLDNRAQIAVQGPKAESVLSTLLPAVSTMPFMTFVCSRYKDHEIFVSRSGYTGEDGYEVSLPSHIAGDFWRALLKDRRVRPIGLGARDSLRLEAGLCLYGNDLDMDTTPIEAGLLWSIGKRRRQQGGFCGAEVITRQIKEGVDRRLVGLDISGRAPCRRGVQIFVGNEQVGAVTSGGFGPSVGVPIAMGYVKTAYAKVGTVVTLNVRGKSIPGAIRPLPFIKHRYKRPSTVVSQINNGEE